MAAQDELSKFLSAVSMTNISLNAVFEAGKKPNEQ